ncbi:MAG TPA: UrcA family protein [Gammaproteobacteria bacterium]|nr:UrcA family protein [Gammaproteobacteria bacterium]
MKRQTSIVLATASFGLLGAWPSLAQQSPATTQTVEEIKVEAPRMVKSTALAQGIGTQVSMSYLVRYGDLDLRQEQAAHDLQNRIETAANEICAELERMYPNGTPSKEQCVRHASDKAMVDARAAIDLARGRIK